jgi:hypothetical protein
MFEAKAREAIFAAVADKYPGWTKVRISTLVEAADGSYLACVDAVDEEKEEIEEVCIVNATGGVRLFDGTGDLIHALAARRPFFSPAIVSGLAFLITLVAVIGFTWAGVQNPEGMDALKGILALAAGFYFGNSTSKS